MPAYGDVRDVGRRHHGGVPGVLPEVERRTVPAAGLERLRERRDEPRKLVRLGLENRRVNFRSSVFRGAGRQDPALHHDACVFQEGARERFCRLSFGAHAVLAHRCPHRRHPLPLRAGQCHQGRRGRRIPRDRGAHLVGALVGGYNGKGSAPVAQLDRALASGARGCAFDSRRAHHVVFRVRCLATSLFRLDHSQELFRAELVAHDIGQVSGEQGFKRARYLFE